MEVSDERIKHLECNVVVAREAASDTEVLYPMILDTAGRELARQLLAHRKTLVSLDDPDADSYSVTYRFRLDVIVPSQSETRP